MITFCLGKNRKNLKQRKAGLEIPQHTIRDWGISEETTSGLECLSQYLVQALKTETFTSESNKWFFKTLNF